MLYAKTKKKEEVVTNMAYIYFFFDPIDSNSNSNLSNSSQSADESGECPNTLFSMRDIYVYIYFMIFYKHYQPKFACAHTRVDRGHAH